MMLDLLTLRELPARLSLEEKAENLDLQIYGIRYRGNVKMELNIVKSEEVYFCNGWADLDVDFECARCLEYYPGKLHGEIEFFIRECSESEVPEGDQIPENQIVIPDNANRVDISALVREALILEAPLKPLCAKDCRGLCPQCGVNRNEEVCHCSTKATDPRWDGLREPK